MNHKDFFYGIASKLTDGSVIKIIHIPNSLTSRIPIDASAARRVGRDYTACTINVNKELSSDLSKSIKNLTFEVIGAEPDIRWIFDFYEKNSKIKSTLYFSGDGFSDVGPLLKLGYKNATPIIVKDSSFLLKLKMIQEKYCS